MNITIIGGARPNFLKIAPIITAIEDKKSKGFDLDYRLVHTGQHYDKKMSGDFFEQLGIPKPHINLGAGGGSHAEQTAAIMVSFEKELLQNPADLVLVVGDVTSTMACAIVAQKLHTKVAHVEGGIRSGDWNMPEEINRMVTDSISNYFFTTSDTANSNLTKLGINRNRIFFVGNTMIDSLFTQMPHFRQPSVWSKYGLKEKEYIVMTLHRPVNVDHEQHLKEVIDTLVVASKGLPLVFPVHPRTAKILEGINVAAPNLHMIEALGYLEFNYLVKHAKAVVTDSGGITEETTVMGIPCMTLRNNTERPETCTLGTNELLGTNPMAIPPAFERLFAGEWKKGSIPELWDGKTAERIIDSILKIFEVHA